jgi:hypothetical protein
MRALGAHAGLLSRARSHGVLALLGWNLQRQGLDGLLEPAERTALAAYRQAVLAIDRELTAALSSLVERVRGDLKDLMVLKGFDLAHSAYPAAGTREMLDVDLLVHIQDVGLARKALADLGWVQGVFDRILQRLVPLKPAEIEQAERGHYECFPFRKLARLRWLDGLVAPDALLSPTGNLRLIDGEVWCSLEIDVHFHLAPGIDIDEVWSAQRAFTVDDLKVKGQSPESLLWFIATRLYHEVMLVKAERLSLFQDVLAILHRWGDQIDWQVVLNVAERYQFHPSLFYVLRGAGELFRAPIPAEVLDQLRPTRPWVSRLHDWGDLLPKMLGHCEVSEISFTD